MRSLRGNSRSIHGVVLGAIIFGVLSSVCFGYSGGSGEPNDPYLIATPNDLNSIGLDPDNWDKHFAMVDDINLADYNDNQFNIIGNFSSPFRGVFDGNNHNILNFTYSSTGTDDIGVFGGITGKICNVGIIDPNVRAGSRKKIGALVGYVKGSATVTNCYVQGGYVEGDEYVGGLIGINAGAVSDCNSATTIWGNQKVGGLIGYSYGTIAECNADSQTVGNTQVGGLLGYNLGTIEDSCCTGSVSGTSNVGGVVGRNNKTVKNCSSCCTVEGTTNVGGLVGNLESGSIKNSHAAGIISGDSKVGGLVGRNYHCSVSYSGSSASVIGNSQVGGLAGYNRGTVIGCYATADVNGLTEVGGLVGLNELIAAYCYARGNVDGNDLVGGLIGNHVGFYSSTTITQCYSTSYVSAVMGSGGLVAQSSGTVKDSFWDVNSSGQSTSAGGTGKTTEQMQDVNTFMAVGWDFVDEADGPSDIWAMPAGGGYPLLWCQLEPLPVLPSFSGGSGEANDPYLIATPNDLCSIGYNPRLINKHYKMVNDVSLAQAEFYIIGDTLYRFNGTFDGNNHTVSNLTYISTTDPQIGLFGWVAGTAQIKDVGLIDPNIDAGTGQYVGALIGQMTHEVSLSGCYVEGGCVSGGTGVGGLVGTSAAAGSSSKILGCNSSTSVSGNYRVGGLIGYNSGVPVTDCHSACVVTGTGDNIGGLVGYNLGDLFNCSSTGQVTGSWWVGGLVGIHFVNEIVNCHSSCSVNGYNLVGGLAGVNGYGSIESCYATGDVVADGYCVGGLLGATAKEDRTAPVSECYASGDVTAAGQVGGFIGYHDSTITNCYSVGDVQGSEEVGGFAGENDGGSIVSSFWDVNSSGQTNSAGGTGKTTAEMQTKSTYTDVGWDFIDIWDICEGTNYPKLSWQIPPLGDFVCPDGVDFIDFAVLADTWLLEDGEAGYNPLCDISIPTDERIDMSDLEVFTENWLEGD